MTRLLVAAWLLLAAAAQAAPATTGCDIAWTFRPRLDQAERRIDASVSFDAGRRTHTDVQLPIPWAGVEDYAAQIHDLRPTQRWQRIGDADEPLHRRVHHRAGERVTLTWRITSPVPDPDGPREREHADLYRTLLGADWFQFFGKGVMLRPLHWSDDSRPRLCLRFDGMDRDDQLGGSLGMGPADGRVQRLRASPQTVMDSVFIGGRLAVRERRIAGRALFTATPARAVDAFAFTPDRFADAVAQVIGAHRRFWDDDAFPHLIVVLQPNRRPQRSGGGTAVHRAFAMHASNDFSVPGEAFDFLVGHEHLHTWIPARFGPMSREGVDDEALRYWFSEGFTNFYTHRLLVTSGMWTLDDHAKVLNQVIERYLASPVRNADNTRVLADFFKNRAVGDLPYQRGEFLALRWHARLRAAGHAGLDAVMKRLLLPAPSERAANASQPLATDRLLEALRPLLGPTVDDDVERFVRRGETAELVADLLGPCFDGTIEPRPVFTLGFDDASFDERRAQGVDPAGPAHAAGLRDGQELAGWSIHGGDTARDVVLNLRDADGSRRELRYRPVAAQQRPTPVYRARPGALQAADCRAWFGL